MAINSQWRYVTKIHDAARPERIPSFNAAMDVRDLLDEVTVMSHPTAERARIAQEAADALKAYQTAKETPGTPIETLGALFAAYIEAVEKVSNYNAK